MEDLAIGIALCIAFAVLIVWRSFYVSERTKWDQAAMNMWVEGYTDFEIENELGPRPE